MNPEPWYDTWGAAIEVASIPIILGILVLGLYAYQCWKDRR